MLRQQGNLDMMAPLLDILLKYSNHKLGLPFQLEIFGALYVVAIFDRDVFQFRFIH